MTAAGGVQVAVVGGGPAGSSIALRLARAGLRVALLDAASFPRSKPCGDCLSPGATPLLEEMGLRGRVEAAGAGRLAGWRTRTPAGTWFEGRFGGAPPAGDGRDGRGDDGRRGDGGTGRPAGGGPREGYALPRRELDALLAEAAVDAGAALRERTRVFGLIRSGDRVAGVRARDGRGRTVTVEADVVVGADGLRSAVARRLAGVRRGPRPRLAMVARLRGVRPRDPAREEPGARRGAAGAGLPLGEMRLGSEGCLGLAPLGGDRWNATLVVPARRAGEISAHRRRFFRRALGAYGVRRRFRDAELSSPLEITGPFHVTPRRVAAPGGLLAGDAAGYFDPLTGQGVHRALASGRAAASAAAALLDARGEARRRAIRRRYRVELDRLLGPGRRVQKLVDAVCRRPGLVEGVGRLLAARPDLASLLVDVTGDRLPASALLDPRRIVAGLLPGDPPSGGRRPEAGAGPPPATRDPRAPC